MEDAEGAEGKAGGLGASDCGGRLEGDSLGRGVRHGPGMGQASLVGGCQLLLCCGRRGVGERTGGGDVPGDALLREQDAASAADQVVSQAERRAIRKAERGEEQDQKNELCRT